MKCGTKPTNHWQFVECRRCGQQIIHRQEPNPTWWAERQAAFREEWEER